MHFTSRRDGVIVKQLGDDVVIYDERAHVAHELNATAAAVWRHCDGRTSVPDIAAAVRDECELPADDDIVRLAVAQLSRAGLMDSLEAGAPQVSRRQLVHRLGAAALLLPVVATVMAPTPAMAQSAPPPSPPNGGGNGSFLNIYPPRLPRA